MEETCDKQTPVKKSALFIVKKGAVKKGIPRDPRDPIIPSLAFVWKCCNSDPFFHLFGSNLNLFGSKHQGSYGFLFGTMEILALGVFLMRE